MTTSSFDADELIDRAADDPTIARELIELFLEDRPQLLEGLRQCLAHPAERRRAAHKLKGSLLALSAKPASAMALDLEQAPEDTSVPELEAQLRQLEAELDRLEAALRQPLPGEG